MRRLSNIYVKRDDEQITISKLNDMIKEEVSRKPYFVFVIYYEGLLAFNMSHIILLPLNLIIMVIILSIFIRISVVLLNMNLVLLLMPYSFISPRIFYYSPNIAAMMGFTCCESSIKSRIA